MDAKMKRIIWKFNISGRGFVYKGIWFCSKNRKQVNRRLIAFNRFDNWFAKDREAADFADRLAQLDKKGEDYGE